jgi:hypothetical protein
VLCFAGLRANGVAAPRGRLVEEEGPTSVDLRVAGVDRDTHSGWASLIRAIGSGVYDED